MTQKGQGNYHRASPQYAIRTGQRREHTMRYLGSILYWSMMLLLFVFMFNIMGHCQIAVTNPSKTGPQQESIYRTLDFISTNVDTQCSTTLPMVQDMIKALEGDRVNPDLVLIGHGNFEHTTVAAFTGATPQTVGYLIVIADNGGFFTDKANAELIPKDSPEIQGQTTFGRQHVDYFLQIAHKYRGGTNVAKVDIILHELSHAVGVAELDYNNTAAGNRNDKRILDNCSKTLKQAEKYKGVL